jgi:hypothetical protein
MRRISDAKVARWLDDDPDRLERHLTRYPDEADRVDVMTSIDTTVRDAMSSDLEVPDDIVARTRLRMRTDDRWKQSVGTVADLFTLPYHVGRTIVGRLGDEADEADQALPESGTNAEGTASS